MRWLRMVQWLHSLQDTLHYGLYAIIAALVLEGTLFIIELILPREGAVPVAAVQQVVHHHHAHSIDATASYPSKTTVHPPATPAQALPRGWSQNVAPDGRVYYTNHSDQTTSWTKPVDVLPSYTADAPPLFGVQASSSLAANVDRDSDTAPLLGPQDSSSYSELEGNNGICEDTAAPQVQAAVASYPSQTAVPVFDATASYPSTTAVPARGSKPEAGAAAVSSSKFCPNCGVQAGAGQTFCSSCGSAL